MKRLVIILALLHLLWVPSGVAAQSGDDRGYLQAFLEDNLSDAGRQVRIVGFAGALSKRATIEELTIADSKGVWLTLRKVVLDWDRAALLKGHLSITQLSAAEIALPRGPVAAESDLPSPEAAGLSLPELPVSVSIAKVDVPKIVLGKALFGEAAVIALQGSASLDAGAGMAKLAITRIDGPKGQLNFEASYSNATRYLDLAFNHTEAKNGIAANLIGLPGRPAVELSLKGAGPLDDFTADIRLATDAEPRLAGQVVLTGVAGETGTRQGFRAFRADIGGDIAPVFLPAYRAFFGPEIRLKLTGKRFDDGRLKMDDLSLITRAMTLNGQLDLGDDGWPERFSVDAEIADEAGKPVLLPIPGAKTRIGRADLMLAYDRRVGEAWRAEMVVGELSRDDGSISEIRLTGSGTLVQGGGSVIGKVQGNATYAAQGIAPADPDLARAIGPELTGGLQFAWSEAAPLVLSNLVVSGADYGLSGALSLQGLSDRLNLSVEGGVALTADSLARFSGLVGTPVTGAAELRAEGAVFALSGAFDMRVTGRGTDLGIGQPQIDPLLDGKARLDLTARRDESGTTIDRFAIATDHLSALVRGVLASGASSLAIESQINDTARVFEGLEGPATLAGTLDQTGSDWAVDLTATGPGGSTAAIKAVAQLQDAVLTRITGQLAASATSLVPFAGIAGQPLSGALELEADGWLDPGILAFAAELDAAGRNLAIGVPVLDPLLRGDSALTGDLRRDDNGIVRLERLNLVTPEGRATVTGTSGEDRTALRFDANLRDLAGIAPGVSGPAQADGTAELIGPSWQIAAQGRGPGGTVARVAGEIAGNGARANLTMAGTAPLALVNTYITPNLAAGQVSYDLALDGPLALSSLSGRITTEAARLVVPQQRLTFTPITASLALSGGRADVEARASVSSGGQINLSGPVALSPPFAADLNIELSGIGVTDSLQYDTTVDGQITMRGALASGARIAADLTLGTTEIRVAESGADTAPVLSGLEHRNEPSDVRQTRVRAGLLGRGSDGARGGAVYPIDILLRAPARIFVRGRGLDAELGGQLRLTGTTADVVTQGRFDLVRGRLDILGKRLTLSEGYARLQGGFDPYLYLVAQTRASDTDIRIIARGLASAPEISFSSSPELPEDEVLARLLFGRDLSKISPLQAVQLAAAVQTLTGGGSGVMNKLRERFGVDDLDITTDENGVAGAKVGKYLSDNVYTDITVGSDGSSEINLNLTISPSVTGRGSVKSNGESSLGIFIERDY